jgi:tripeptide aminopeptidase
VARSQHPRHFPKQPTRKLSAVHFSSPLAVELAEDVLERLIRYARIDTQSTTPRERSPSTHGQLDLSRLLEGELRELGLDDVTLDDNGYVTATLPGTGETTIGLLAHVDTSPDAPGAGVEPLVHRDYDGGVIVLPHGGTRLDPAAMPELLSRVGHDLVTASGDTLLGADDKAGVAEIMAAVAHLVAHPERPRATLRIGFTPDEEIGHGATLFPLERFAARYAYTFDGSEPGELQDETFSAAAVDLTIDGVAAHPGFATGRMVNAAVLAARIVEALPRDRLTPETTSEREGFIHVHDIVGAADRAVIKTIVRDFDDALLQQHIELLSATAGEIVAAEPRARLQIEVTSQYPNMRRYVEAHPQVVANAERAIREEGYEPLRTAIRGGTDGSQLSAKGLPTPNIFTGGHEFHSPREWASVQEMAGAAAVAVRLAGIWAA